jgi:hypothetical protein
MFTFRMKIMKKNYLAATLSLSLCAGVHAATLDVPTTTVLGTDVFTGPTFTVSGNFGASDDIDVTVSGTVDLASGDFTANAAGILVSPATANTGAHPGQTSPGEFGFPYASLLIGNSALGFVPLFPADAADGLGNSTPPTTLTVDETLGSLFGSSVSITNGEVLDLLVDDINTGDNSGSYTVGNTVNGVPDAATTVSLLGLSLGGLAALRRRLA